MHATNKYYRYNNSTSLFVHLVFFGVLVSYSIAEPVSYDAFYHLNMGNEFLKNGFAAWSDKFSFTFYGQHVNNPPYIFQSILALYVAQFDLQGGHIALRITVYAIFIVTLFLFYRANRIKIPIILLTLPFISLFFMHRAVVRPELFFYPLFVLALLFYIRAQAQFESRKLLPIAVLLLFWVNYYVPVFGYIIFFGLFVEKGIRKLQHKESFTWLFWSGWATILFVIGYMNPEYKHFFFSMINFDSGWKEITPEYFSTFDFQSKSIIYPVLYLSLLLTIYLLIKRQYGLFIASLVFTLGALQMYRLVAIYAIFHLLVIAYIANLYNFSSTFNRLHKSMRFFLKTGLIILVCTGFYLNIAMSNELRHTQKTHKLPTDLVEHLRRSSNGGNIFNRVELGGYLSYELAPDYKVYIDGRTNVLYSLDFVHHFISLFKNPALLREEIRKYDIKYSIISRNPALFSVLYKTGLMNLDYIDDNFLLMKTSGARYPVAGLLMLKPACWNVDIEQAALEENLKKISFGDSEKEVMQFREMLSSYLSLPEINREQFVLDFSSNNPNGYDSEKRLAAYISLDYEHFGSTRVIMESIDKKDIQDYIFSSYLYSKLGDYHTALQILNFVLVTDWPRVRSNYLLQKGTRLTQSHKAIILDLLYQYGEQMRSPEDQQLIQQLIETLTGAQMVKQNRQKPAFNTIESLCLSDY